MKTLKTLLASSLVLSLAACSQIPGEAYYNRGAPESLLDVSSEVVNLVIASEQSLDELVDVVDQDNPTRAELYCPDGDALCSAAEEVMSLYAIDYELIPSNDSVVNLYYERVLAHDCENRFIDNSINPYNLNHPSFGCSSASNMVQMVADRNQFINPELLGYADGDRAVRTYRRYLSYDAQKDGSSDKQKYSIEGQSRD